MACPSVKTGCPSTTSIDCAISSRALASFSSLASDAPEARPAWRSASGMDGAIDMLAGPDVAVARRTLLTGTGGASGVGGEGGPARGAPQAEKNILKGHTQIMILGRIMSLPMCHS